jgi:transcriptional regulator of arginine metabolism
LKRQRQALIAKKINSGQVKSQRDLVEMLSKEGYRVSQTTVSRDLAELGYSKGRDRSGIPRYAGAAGAGQGSQAADGALTRIAPEVMLDAEATGNIIVVKTSPGNAQGLAWAIDAAAIKGIAGTVAGDDTIMVACSAGADSRRIRKKLLGYATGGR